MRTVGHGRLYARPGIGGRYYAGPGSKLASSQGTGDLFRRLVQDYFTSLGYAECRLNVQKSGREIDLSGVHRTEKRMVVAECKNHKAPIGGDDAHRQERAP